MTWLRSIWNKAWRWVRARYEGATFSPSRSWIPAGIQSARFDATASTRLELVRKSRYFERNNPILNKLADVFECGTVGYGRRINPSSSSPDFNKAAADYLATWEKQPDLCSTQSFGCLQSLMARSWFIDGEIFILKTRAADKTPKVQLIEAHRVGTPQDMAKMEGQTVIDGITIDRFGRPTGYYVAQEGERGDLKFGAPIPAESIIHLFEPSRSGQYRGLPFCYPVINELHDLDDLHLLEMKAARMAARIAITQKNKNGEFNAEGMIRSRFQQSTTTNAGAAASESRSDYYEKTFGGDAIALQIGDELSQFAGERPSVVTKDYWRYKTELVCAGIGIPYVLVFPDSMQGTVYRGSLSMADAFFRSRAQVIAAACEEIYRYVMLWATANVPALRDKPGDWASVSILPPRSANVDVGRNSAAMLAELEKGATNYEQIYAPLGLDWREQFRKLKEQQDFAASIGLNLASNPIMANTEGNPPAGDAPSSPPVSSQTYALRRGENVLAPAKP